MKLLDTVKSLIECMPSPRMFEGYNIPISESRVLNLHLPRRSGKTTTIKALSKEYSSIVLVPGYVYRDVMGYAAHEAFVDLDEVSRTFRGTKSCGLRYRYILIDESTNIRLPALVSFLKSCDILESDYRIIQLGTTVR